jgi:uncharacterized protein YxjI
MKKECREKFLNHLIGIDIHICLGYNWRISDIEVGWVFHISPNEVWNMSTDKFTLEDAFKFRIWEIKETLFHYSDRFKVLKIQRNRTRKQDAVFRVKNLRTNVDFDLFKSNDSLEDTDSLDLFFIQ